MNILTSHDFKNVPWKNGGGITTELYRRSHPTDPDKFLVRLSMATVDRPGPFSTFPGIDRTLCLLSGEGLRLQFKKHSVDLREPYKPLRFSGEDEIHCSLLGGPVTDFNVMVDRGFGRCELKFLELREQPFICNDSEAFIFIVKGALKFDQATIRKGSLLHLSAKDIFQLSPIEQTHALVINYYV